MKRVLLQFCLLLFLVPISAQEAQFATDGGECFLVWPFDNSYPINFYSGSNGWSMINGSARGLHHGSEYFALDWVRPQLPTCGIPFKAPLSGSVIWVETTSDQGYGNHVIIQSDQDSSYAFILAHMETVTVELGQKLKVGDVIGTIGETGQGTCHGHLALYRRLYDLVALPETQADSMNASKDRAIDLLRRGDGARSPRSNPTYFAAPYRFLPSEDGLELLQLTPNKRQLGNEDTLKAVVKIVNKGASLRAGRLLLEIQTERIYNYYYTRELSTGELLRFLPKDTVTVNLEESYFKQNPGSYYLHLVLMHPDTVNGIPSGIDSATPIASLPIEFFSSDLCQRNEPNNSFDLATELFSEPLHERRSTKTKEAYLSSNNDPRDIYTFISQKIGRFDLEILNQKGFIWQVSTIDGAVETINNGQQLYFYTKPGETYYLTVEGPQSCLEPYQFAYTWEPIEVLEWTLEPTDVLQNSFEVLDPVEAEWMVIDMLGRRLWQSGKKQLGVGSSQFRDEVPLLQPGIYNVVLIIDGKIADHKRFYWRD
ncbi:MAG: hypothetical protein Sapg2KO_47410 [Saprospiraceae bacterium]